MVQYLKDYIEGKLIKFKEKKMKTAGIEPATDGFGIRHSTAELSLRTINRRNHVHEIII